MKQKQEEVAADEVLGTAQHRGRQAFCALAHACRRAQRADAAASACAVIQKGALSVAWDVMAANDFPQAQDRAILMLLLITVSTFPSLML